jgi:hypothetical protein
MNANTGVVHLKVSNTSISISFVVKGAYMPERTFLETEKFAFIRVFFLISARCGKLFLPGLEALLAVFAQ